MRIQNNIPAMNTHRVMGINNTNMAKSLEKLSSGYRINRAGDDAAGLAISEKMRAQIRGLTMASKNSSDAISLVQTAEGALQSTHDIIQRMRELAVQASSDTNEQIIDRGALDQEYQALKKELNDISTQTRFNDQNLLDGTFQALISTQNNPKTTITNVNSMSVARATAGEYQLTTALKTATEAVTTPGTPTDVFQDGLINMAAQSDIVDSVDFTGLDTDAHNGNIYELRVSGSDIKNMTFRLVDTNGDTVATAQNVNTSTWSATNPGKVVFSGVGTFEFTMKKQVTDADLSQLESLSGSKVEFFAGVGFDHAIAAFTAAEGALDTAGLAAINAKLVTDGTGVLAVDVSGLTATNLLTSSGTPMNVALVSSIDDKGNVIASVVDDKGNVLATDTKLITDIKGDGSANQTLDLGAFGKIVLKNGDANDITLNAASPASYAPSAALPVGFTQTGAATAIGGIDLSTLTFSITSPGNSSPVTASDITIGGTPAGVTVSVKSSSTSTDGVGDLNAGSIVFEIDGGALGKFEYTATIGVGTAIGGGTGANSTIQTALRAFNITIAQTPAVNAGALTPIAAPTLMGAAPTATGITTAPVAAAPAAVAGGVTPVSTTAERASMDLTINGETITLYKGDTYANFANLGISFSFNELSDLDIANQDLFGVGGSAKIVVNAQQGKELIIQAGANQGDELGINIDRISTETLGLTYSNLSTQRAASQAITEVNTALNKVSTQRAALGALQNRLEFKISNLDTSAENLQSAESRIRDVDMAKEMMNFTKSNILAQAATAMMAQANSMPQNVLQLLR